MITSLAQNSPPSLVFTKLFSSPGTLHVDVLFSFAAWDFVCGKICVSTLKSRLGSEII